MSKIENWISKIGEESIPVLPDTIRDVAQLCSMDNVSIPDLTEVIERDPGLTVQILRSSNLRKRGSLSTDITSVKQALLMMGTEQLSRLPAGLPDIDKTLTEASSHRLLAVFSRAYHAGHQATEWAIARRDMTPDEVFAAAELHFLAEMLFAIHAPEVLQEIDSLCREKHISANEAQYLVLGFSFNQFTRALARKWQLPKLVIEALHDSNAQYPRAYGVMLAVQVAQSASIDWYSQKTFDIYQMVAEWLGDEIDTVITQSHKLAVSVAQHSAVYRVNPAAYYLPMLPAHKKSVETHSDNELVTGDSADVCLSPQIEVLKRAISEIQHNISSSKPLDIIARTTRAMHDGIGLNRVVFALYDADRHQYRSRVVVGAANDPHFSRFHIDLKNPSLFSELMKKTQGVVINDESRQRFWSLVPEEFARLIGTNSFMAMSLHIHDKPFGMFYADRHSSSCQIDNHSYQYFKMLSSNIGKLLASMPRINIEE